MTDSTVVLRRNMFPSKRRLWQALSRTRGSNRTQFFGDDSDLARKQSRTQFSGNNETIEKLLGEIAKDQALQSEKIVIFLDREKYVVPRSKLLEWDTI